jgi:hypothetical protein
VRGRLGCSQSGSVCLTDAIEAFGPAGLNSYAVDRLRRYARGMFSVGRSTVRLLLVRVTALGGVVGVNSLTKSLLTLA